MPRAGEATEESGAFSGVRNFSTNRDITKKDNAAK
jgi:hypothetical protein